MIEVTTVSDDTIVLHQGANVRRFEGLASGTEHYFDGIEAITLVRPAGQLLCRFATLNDVHFGEDECGKIDDDPQGPIQRSRPGEPPYPEMMNAAARDEIAAIDPVSVLVKGDLTARGTDEEFAAFESCYRETFEDRLYVVRGNHDAYLGQNLYAGDQWIEMPGICVALMDTTIPTLTTGAFEPSQIEWLDQHASQTSGPILVMGHHQQWIEGNRSADYFGLHPDSSDALNDVISRRTNIIGYTAGHTHRHRVRKMSCGVPSVEIGCLKDFPGTWAEYRVYEGGVMQVVHRVSTPEALEWSERCRFLYADFGIDYQTYALGSLGERCFVFPERS